MLCKQIHALDYGALQKHTRATVCVYLCEASHAYASVRRSYAHRATILVRNGSLFLGAFVHCNRSRSKTLTLFIILLCTATTTACLL
jgi:hypothetical protein